MMGTHDSPGVAGMAILREVTRPEWLRQPQGDFTVFRRHPAFDLRWDSGRPGPCIYDKNAMYVGAASSAKLGVGIPEFVHAPALEDRAGLWHIIVEGGLGGDLVPLLVKMPDSWQYTPMVQALLTFGYQVRAVEAWLFPESHAVLRPFYERIRTLRDATVDQPEARGQIKRLYTVTFGILAHLIPDAKPGYLYRPDWFFTLVAEACARMHYQMRKVLEVEGVAPSAAHTDALFYPHPVASLPLGPGIGQFKYTQRGESLAPLSR